MKYTKLRKILLLHRRQYYHKKESYHTEENPTFIVLCIIISLKHSYHPGYLWWLFGFSLHSDYLFSNWSRL